MASDNWEAVTTEVGNVNLVNTSYIVPLRVDTVTISRYCSQMAQRIR